MMCFEEKENATSSQTIRAGRRQENAGRGKRMSLYYKVYELGGGRESKTRCIIDCNYELGGGKE